MFHHPLKSILQSLTLGVVGIGYTLTSSILIAHAEDLERLAPQSIEFIRRTGPEAQTSEALLRWYELMQARNERMNAVRANPPNSTDADDQYRVPGYAVEGAVAHDAEVERLTAEIRRLQPSIQRQIFRDELMMWYAPEAYLPSLRDPRHRRAIENYGWLKQTSLAEMTGRPNYERNLARMHDKRHAHLREEGWSETFWPDFTGSLAVPYADPGIQLNFLNFLFFEMNHRFLKVRPQVQQHIAATPAYSLGEEEIARLSPAEKYDLLLGDLDFTFTTRVLQMVDEIQADGQMANWTGVCDGWSSASQHYFRPEESVVVTGARGHRIKFYPTDIKGLASFLWAKSFDRGSSSLSKGTGYQCKRNERDAITGRLLDPTCNDINPGYFHTAAVNTLGIDKHGFIFDKAHSPNVLNQPAFAYEYKYFRPDNQAETQNLELAKKRIGSFRDAFAAYRSPRATHVVGVKMRVWYKKEHPQPQARERDRKSDDRDYTVDLRYDLELDANGDIVGGEWWFYNDMFRPNLVDDVNDSHPDTFWLVVPGTNMFSTANWNVPTWEPGQPVPAGMLPYAKAAARTLKPPFGPNDSVQHDVFRPQPLPQVVDTLVQLARPGHEKHFVERVPGRYRETFCGRWDATQGKCVGWTDTEWDFENRTGREYPFR